MFFKSIGQLIGDCRGQCHERRSNDQIISRIVISTAFIIPVLVRWTRYSTPYRSVSEQIKHCRNLEEDTAMALNPFTI